MTTRRPLGGLALALVVVGCDGSPTDAVFSSPFVETEHVTYAFEGPTESALYSTEIGYRVENKSSSAIYLQTNCHISLELETLRGWERTNGWDVCLTGQQYPIELLPGDGYDGVLRVIGLATPTRGIYRITFDRIGTAVRDLTVVQPIPAEARSSNKFAIE